MTTSPSSASRSGALARLTDRVLAHRRLVVAAWIVLTLAGMFAAGRLDDALDTSFAMPDSEGFMTNEAIKETFGGGGAAPLVAVVELPDGATVRSPGVREDLVALEAQLAAALPGARIASFGSTGDRAFVSGDGTTTFALVRPPLDPGGGDEGIGAGTLEAARAAAQRSEVAGVPVLLTGEAALGIPSEEQEGGGVLVETLIAGLLALAVLAYVFASALALVPLLMAVVAIPSTFLGVWALTAVTEVSVIVQFLVALIGLGIAIDYALVIVTRWREEREGGTSNEAAVRHAMATAGSAVVFSGTTVAVGLLAAVALPIPFLRSLAYGGLLTALVSVLVALTLLPVVLATLGPRADRRRLRRTERAERHWAAWARLVVRRRVPAAAGASAILVALCVVAGSMVLGVPASEPGGTSVQADAGLAALERSDVGAAPLWPVEVLTLADRAQETARTLAGVEGVRAVAAPGCADWRSDERAVLEVLPAADTNSDAGRATVDAVREAATGLPATGVGGYTAQAQDFVDDVYGSFPLMLGLIGVVTFVLLARAFRSILLPLKAVALNLLSVFATWGVITLVWQHGFGSELLFGAAATGAVVEWVPLIVFAFLYGLSMDYEVFILARTREAYDATGSTDEAITRGIARTGRLVTSAALIVFLAFAMLGFAGDVDLQMLATGLAAGVLVDALLVRALLVPALVSLFGRWNWWLPELARRALRLPCEPLPAAQGAVGDR